MSATCVVVDRWDREDLESIAGMARYVEARTALAGRMEAGGELLDDLFFVFLKAAPELVVDAPAGREQSLVVLAELVDLEPVQALRRSTRTDPFASANAAAELADTIAAVVEALMEVPGAGRPGASDEEGAGEEGGDGDESDESDGPSTRVLAAGLSVAGEAAEGLAEDADERERAGAAWGLEPGSLRYLSLAERERMEKLLDSERVRRVADLFGRLRSAAFAQPAEVEEGWGEVVDLELGDDLARVLPAELLGLVEAGLEDVFFSRLANSELMLMRAVREDDLALGGIVLCVDGSGSMHRPFKGYTREMWAQAFKLLLIRQAQRQGRPLHVVDFGAEREFRHVGFETPGDFAPERVLSTVGAFFGGGTCFETGLRVAVKAAASCPGQRSDIVFVSDGEGWLSPDFLRLYEARTAELGVRTWGVLVKGSGTLPFVREQWSVADFAGGPEVGELLARIA